MSEMFGDYLKRLREQKGLTIQQLSNLSGVSIAQISRLENGLRKTPEVETLKKLSAALVNASYIELMTAAGYFDDLTAEELKELKQSEDFKFEIVEKNKTLHPDNAEVEFVESLDLSDEELIAKFNPKLDGQELSVEEYREMIAYIRVKRQMSNASENEKQK